MRYIVKTGSAVNEMMLHSTMKAEFETSDFDEALKAFEEEVKELGRCYDKGSRLSYNPSQRERDHAIQCQIVSMNGDGEIEYIMESEYFFER